MSTCSNCYSGCTSIHSDKCLRYTGMDIDVLGIKNGDSLNYVQSAIMGFLVSVLDGSGIKYELDPGNLCDIISDALVDCTDCTVESITNALSAAICAIDGRLASTESDFAGLELPYTMGCVPGTGGANGTHITLQAVIDHLCTVTTDLDALELNVSTNYVASADLNSLISAYLSAQGGGGVLERDKMVPYTVVEYYGPLTYFDATGAGTGDWIDIFLCNGNNGTPDKRGRIAVGTTSGMGGGSYPSATDPLISGNPTYYLYSTTGTNTVTLTSAQIPSHTHTANVTVTDPGHKHLFGGDDEIGTVLGYTKYNSIAYDADSDVSHDGGSYYTKNVDGTNTPQATNITVDVTNNATGGGNSHSNIPPVLACHYIIYIPS